MSLLSVAQAAQALADGGLVALPTETVYGLAARADDDRAVAKIFATKGRPARGSYCFGPAAPDRAPTPAQGISA